MIWLLRARKIVSWLRLVEYREQIFSLDSRSFGLCANINMGVSLIAELHGISLCFLEIYDIKYRVYFYTSLF